MNLKRLKVITALFLLVMLLFPALSFAKGLTLFQKIKYKEAHIMDPTGRETKTLINRFTDKVEYSWAIDKWIEAAPHLQDCYKKQDFIKQNVNRRNKALHKYRRRTRRNR